MWFLFFPALRQIKLGGGGGGSQKDGFQKGGVDGCSLAQKGNDGPQTPERGYKTALSFPLEIQRYQRALTASSHYL